MVKAGTIVPQVNQVVLLDVCLVVAVPLAGGAPGVLRSPPAGPGGDKPGHRPVHAGVPCTQASGDEGTCQGWSEEVGVPAHAPLLLLPPHFCT